MAKTFEENFLFTNLQKMRAVLSVMAGDSGIRINIYILCGPFSDAPKTKQMEQKCFISLEKGDESASANVHVIILGAM